MIVHICLDTIFHMPMAATTSNIENGLILVLDAIGGSHSGLIGQFRQVNIWLWIYTHLKFRADL